MTKPNPVDFPPRMNRKQAAEYLGVSVGTLAQDIVTNRHRFPVIRCGRRCIYDRLALDAWLSAHAINTPAEVA